METTIRVEIETSGGFEAFLDELRLALETRGITLELKTLEASRAVVEWHVADWDPDDLTELELRSDGERITVELRGFGRSFWDDEDGLGWFADQVVAPWLDALTPQRFGDWWTDRAARRPFGVRPSQDYKDPTHHRPSFGAVLDALQLQPDDVLIEIGPGGGAFLQQALQSGCHAVGVDHSPEMVRAARELNADAIADGRLDVVEGDAGALPLRDDTFTCAAMMQVFFFLPDPAAALAECHRVLKPGGRLAVYTMSEEARGTPAAPEPMASRSRFYTNDELVRLALDAGFAAAHVEHPDLEPHARAAGLPDDVVELFRGDATAGQLLLAARAG